MAGISFFFLQAVVLRKACPRKHELPQLMGYVRSNENKGVAQGGKRGKQNSHFLWVFFFFLEWCQRELW